jgi:predicted Zn-dependent peptidase
MVTKPYFTEESVAKEQGIIGQEIDMNADAPESRIFEDLMGIMYENHPVREPILGTRQTIGQLTPEMLYRCHRACYNPANMILCVVADCDPEEIVQAAQALTADMPCPEVKLKRQWQEPEQCGQKLICSQMEIARPMFQIGFKCDAPGDGEQGIYREFVGDLAAEVLFGESSELYLQMYEQGLIDPSFGGGLDTVPDMALLTATGDSDDPYAVRDAILDRVEKLLENTIAFREENASLFE